MKIGIDISQLTYANTGVATYLAELVGHLAKIDKTNQYILFFSSFRRQIPSSIPQGPNIKLKRFYFPPTILDMLWNRMHTMPIEQLLGNVDVFISSDWTQPPARKAKLATILYDLIVYKYPKETASSIVRTQKKRLLWVKKECDLVFCISESTKRDAMELLHIPEEKIRVIYPGVKSE